VVAAVDTRITEANAFTLLGGATPHITQLTAMAMYNHPAVTTNITQSTWEGLIKSSPNVKITQASTLVLWSGSTGSRRVRAWAFSQDGHDFYVLRGGSSWSLVYDLTTGQWSQWASPSLNYLRTHIGLNWQGQSKTSLDAGYAWNVVGGDDTLGMLWMLDPSQTKDTDENNVDVEFTRKAIGMVPVRLRDTGQCGAVYLTANVGAPSLVGDGVTLSTSDDSGFNWNNQGTITVTSGDTNQEFAWIGLGIMKAPGRMFQVTDSGAFARISSLDMRP
jgi:hypothetical protein